MSTSSMVTFALSVTAVSTAACPKLANNPDTKSTDTFEAYCQFPSSIDCPVDGRIHIIKEARVQEVVNADRSGQPLESSAANTGSVRCSTP